MTNGVNEHPHPRRLAFYSLGFLRPKLRAMLHQLGYQLVPFGLGKTDAVAVWGRKRVSKRGFKAALRKGVPILTIEDGLIRSIRPGWQEAPRALSLDDRGVYFDITQGSAFEDLLLGAGERDLAVAKAQMDLQVRLGISKYNATQRGGWTKRNYVLVVDQVKGDQSITYGQADEANFAQALAFAKSTFPDDPILIRAHPSGEGYFGAGDLDARTEFCDAAVNPFDLIENAKAVVVVTSQLGFDAIMAGHRPHVFGAPFYAGLGLSEDHFAKPRAALDAATLYNVAINQYPKYFAQDLRPSDALTEIFALHDEMAQIARTQTGFQLKNIRAWKRPHMKRFFPKQEGERVLRWGARAHEDEWVVEDGFLRSEGLGAKLVPPLSLVIDQKGIYFDPTRPSDLEALIHGRSDMHPLERARAEALQASIVAKGISKYNLPSAPLDIPNGAPVLLVVGQVEDDRSIILGATGDVKTNDALLGAARRDHPDHFVIYKPHPDVVAGLRVGKIDARDADLVVEDGGIEALWPHVDALATITSLSGFEALLRGKSVSCYGMPFYADWGLTRDFAPPTGRRGKADLAALVYASLIDYPLYLDPKTRRYTTAEVIVDRIARHETEYPAYLRAMTWVQQKFYRAGDAIKNGSRSSVSKS